MTTYITSQEEYQGKETRVLVPRGNPYRNSAHSRRAEVVLACILTWVWADEVSTDGGLGRFDLDDVDFAARQAGFGQAMMDVGWLAKADDGLFLPNYHVWNGTTAKARILKNRRMAEWRNAHEPSTAPSTAPSARPSTGESPK